MSFYMQTGNAQEAVVNLQTQSVLGKNQAENTTKSGEIGSIRPQRKSTLTKAKKKK